MKVICNHCNKEKNGIQTGICNHCGRFGNIRSSRELAMSWWNNLSDISIQMPSKSYLCEKYHGNMRIHKSLTGSEIENIWNQEKNVVENTFQGLINKGIEFGEAKLKTTKFFVEATSTEKFYLWKERTIFNKDIKWENESSGIAKKIGEINPGQEVWLSIFFAEIENCTVVFYEVTSRFNDTLMVENWIKNNYPVKYDNNTRWAMTNAANFHHCIHACQNNNFTIINK